MKLSHAELLDKLTGKNNGLFFCSNILKNRKNRRLPCGRAGTKTLLFKNLISSPDNKWNGGFSQSTLYLASSLKKNGFKVLLSDAKLAADKHDFLSGKNELCDILSQNPDINLICLTICEDYFLEVKKITEFIRGKSDAFIGIGGTMPTLTPEHAFAHMPEINFLVRGAGEEIITDIAKIIKGKNIFSNFEKDEINDLSNLNGLIFRTDNFLIKASLNKINSVANFDNSKIDFSFFGKQDVKDGLVIYSSRGCLNRCFFCTTFGHGKFLSKSAENLRYICENYASRLRKLFKNNIPDDCLTISFYDDDFLSDHIRARDFFDYLRNSPIKVRFFQTGIKSLFKIPPKTSTYIFSQDKVGHVYIGTENFCDFELKRLGKGYSFKQINQVVRSLSIKKIVQFHHLILSNSLTTPAEIAENLYKIAKLQHQYEPYFNILTPIIPYLVSLYPSISYKIALAKRRKKFLNISKVLSIKQYNQYDYPFVKNDIPVNFLTRELVPVIEQIFKYEKNYKTILDACLFELLLLSRHNLRHKRYIETIVEKTITYPALILKETKKPVKSFRGNIQLMMTRRCHLRCLYCPVKKQEYDMQEKTALNAVKFLFTSNAKDLRLDFTGGEPLLKFDLIRKAVIYAKRLADKNKKGISFYMVTNLIALTDEIADFLSKERFFLELSVDGSEYFHNLYKKSVDKNINPYKATSGQLNRIFSKGIANCGVMVVSPRTVRNLLDNFSHLLALGFKNIGINYALGSFWNEESRSIYFQQLNRIKSRYSALLAKGTIRLNNLATRSEPAILNSEIMVDVSGKIHLLTDWLFENYQTAAIPAQGAVGEALNLGDIYLSPAIVLYRLLKYNRTRQIRNIIFNNIEMGYFSKRYFDSWKNK